MRIDNIPQSMDVEVSGDNGMLQGMAEALPTNIDLEINHHNEETPEGQLSAIEPQQTPQGEPSPAAADAPENAAKQPEENKGFLDYLLDVGKGIANGPINSVNETIDLAGTLAQGGEEFNVVEAAAEHGIDMENFGPTETGAGKAAEQLSTFLSGFLTGGALLKGVKLLQGSTKAATLARGAAKSFYSTVTSFDGHEEMLSNAIQESPALQNVITEALAVDKDDNELVGRLKHGFEDLGIGMALESALAVVGVYRASKATTKAAKDQIYSKTVEHIRQVREETGEAATDAASGVKGVSEDAKSLLHTEAAQEAKEAAKDSFRPDSLINPGTLKDLIGDGKAANLDDALNILARGSTTGRVTGRDILHSEHGFDFLKHVQETVESGTTKQAPVEVLDSLSSTTDDLVQRYGMDTKTIQSFAEKAITSGEAEAVKASAQTLGELKTAMDFFTGEFLKIARKLHVNPASVSMQEKLDLATLKKNIDSVYKASDELAANEAKAEGQKAFQWHASPSNLSEEQIRSFLTREGWNHDNMARIARDAVINADNKGAIAQAVNTMSTGTKLGIFQEFRISNMLSGPMTMVANAGSNFMKALLMPTERYLSGVITKDKALRQEAIDTLSGLYTYFTDSMKLAKKAFRTEDGLLEGAGSVGKMESNGAQITYDNIRAMMLDGKPRGTQLNTMQELIASSAGVLGPYLRLPSRILVGTDEFFKQLNFRASLGASLRREAMEGGLKDAQAIESYVNEQMRLAITGRGAARNDEALKPYLEYARQATWTQDLGEQTLAGGFQRYANDHPMIRVVVPFIKTPANILRDFVAHTPAIGQLSRDYRAAIAAGGEQAALARAKMATGSLIWAGAVGLAMSGAITGSPPKDPKQRKALEATGWQPYSIKIGDGYYSYKRYDPAGMVLSLAADLTIAGQNMTEANYENLASSLVVAIANGVTSKTFMKDVRGGPLVRTGNSGSLACLFPH
ncbi:MAG: hypothetical protein BCS36_03220 [Desulfovibrio sp. MES5]|uniref:hypothetical protein n=1 Tax=Desulfovibrio sp. MES5 TaxID=1899016 RepID=UPI000B9D20BF|nr:hypothetical protein [Desulfovibrio sp. MES5]OXS29884.1 MAG: hypothetical protein BCS36_03220 [Desulfovibrio sp. MES5]